MKTKTRIVVKRKGHTEPYDEKKVYASVYAAALNCHYDEMQSEKIASEVMKKINKWAAGKTSLASTDIREQILKTIQDKYVALMYKHHMELC